MRQGSRLPDIAVPVMMVCLTASQLAADSLAGRECFEHLMQGRTPGRFRPIPFLSPPVIHRSCVTVPSGRGVDSVIRDDFLVNDDGYGGTKQNGPVVDVSPAGDFVVAWYDFRDGNADCWLQRFDSAAGRLGGNERINTDATMGWQSDPALSVGDDGRFVLSWEDRWETGNSDIFCQRYDGSGGRLGGNFRVGDSATNGDQIISGIHMGPHRGFLVTWDDRRNGITGDIYAQFLDSNGTRVDSNFRVNDDAVGRANQYEPAISGDDSGRYVVAWMDGRGLNGYDWNIFAQRFDRSGNRLGSNIQVTTNDSVQWVPWVGCTPAGRFMVTWDDRRKGPADFDVYARLYDSDGQPMGDEFRVNDDVLTTAQSAGTVAANRYGEFLVVWADTRNGDEDVYGQLYTADGDTIGDNFRVSPPGASGNQGVPNVAARPDGGFWVAWADFREGNYDIYAQHVGRDRQLVGTSLRVNDDSTSSHQRVSSIAMDEAGRFIVAWEDERVADIDVYARVYDTQGCARGPAIRLNDDVGPASQYYAAAAAGRDLFLVTWTDGRADFNTYGQFVDSLGRTVGGNFVVNNEPGGHLRWYSYAAMDDSDRSVVVWQDTRPTFGYRIYARRFDASGNPLGDDFYVPESVGPQVIYASVSAGSGGRFVVSWMDYRNDTLHHPDIYCRVFGSDGSPLGGDIRVDSDTGGYYQGYPSCAMADDNGFAVCWEETRREAYDVFLQYFDSTGARLGGEVIVNDGPRQAASYGPTCAFGPDGRLVVIFNDERSESGSPDMYGQVFLADRTRAGRNQLVSNPKFFPGNVHWSVGSSVDVSGGTIASAWTDNRRHQGWDIYAKVMDWGLVGMAGNQTGCGPSRSQVRPTVTNGRVCLSLPPTGNVAGIRVYDPAGRQVLYLERPGRSPVLDLRHLSAGVYVIVVQSKDHAPDVRSKVVLK